MRSYYFKNFITVAALVLLSFLILGASFVLVGRNYALRERRETIESNVIELSRLASAYAQDGSLEDWNFRITLSAVARSTGNLCFITGEEMQQRLAAFLEILFEAAPQSIGGAVPGDDFYCILK